MNATNSARLIEVSAQTAVILCSPVETACSVFVCKQLTVTLDLERGIYLGEELPEQNLV